MTAFDTIVLTHDITEYNLRAGDIGAIIDIPPSGTTCIVEFVTLLGKTIAIIEVEEASVRALDQDEIATVRSIH